MQHEVIDSDLPVQDRASSVQLPDPRRWVALVVVLVAGFMDLLDATIVNVAVPSIQRDLQARYSQVEWMVAGYVLAFAAVLITGGRLGDIFGRKRLFLIGVTGFTIASALCGLAGDPTTLIVARFLQGATAGLMVPQILAIIHATFPREERGKVFGLFGAVLGSAAVAGLTLGGVLVEWNLFELAWRPIFLVNVPVGIAALIAAKFFVRESRSATAPKLDLPGMVLAVAAILMLVYPLIEGRRLGWPAWTFALMVGGLALLGVFVAYERWRTRTVGSPLVVLALFRARSFAAGMGLWLIFWIALGGFFLIWTLYMQVGLGWTPLRAGLTSLAFAFAAAAGAGTSVAVFVPKFGRRVLMAGALLNAVGFGGYLWIAWHYGASISSWQMIAPLAVAGLGYGLVVATTIDTILTDVPVRDAGSASGLLNTAQQLGMALGVALVGMVFFAHLDNDSAHGVDTVTPALHAELADAGVPAAGQDDIVAGFGACVQDRSAAIDPTEIPTSCQSMPGGSSRPGSTDAVADVLARAGEQANAANFARTFSLTMWYAVSILVVVFACLFALPRRARIGAEFEAVG